MASIFENLLKRNAAKTTSEKPSEQKNPPADQVRSEEIPAPSEPVKAPSETSVATVNRTRNKTMNLRFSPEELDEMNEKISQSGLSKTEFILECVRDHPVIVIPELSECMTEFRKQGVNLNQMAKSLNEYAVALKKHGLEMYDEQGTWRAITTELEDLRAENLKTQELLKKILEAVNSASGRG